MDDSDPAPDRRSSSPEGIVPAVGQRLRRLLADIPTPFPCTYACFIHARRRQGEHGFGVITVAGESLPLTVTMLTSLREVPTLFEGRTRVIVGPGDDQDSLIPAGYGADWSVPLPVARLTLRMAAGEQGEGSEGEDEQLLTPTDEGFQLTLLCAGRPAGWPG